MLLSEVQCSKVAAGSAGIVFTVVLSLICYSCRQELSWIETTKKIQKARYPRMRISDDCLNMDIYTADTRGKNKSVSKILPYLFPSPFRFDIVT